MVPHATQATGDLFQWRERSTPRHAVSRDKHFQRVGTFANYRNNGTDAADETVSEIVSATADGYTLVYTDGVRGTVGFIDIRNPARPRPGGTVVLDPTPTDDIQYSPTSVDVLGNTYALVGVNTSESHTNTSGKLVVIDVVTHAIVTEIDLGGQPDSVKISPDGSMPSSWSKTNATRTCVSAVPKTARRRTRTRASVAVAPWEGCRRRRTGNPPGFVAVLKIGGHPLSWGPPQVVDLTGLATYAAADPEPEFVDINEKNEAVVTLQENNHVVVIALPTLTITRHFPAGAVTLTDVDLTDDGVISLTETRANVRREPDAVAWVPGASGRSTSRPRTKAISSAAAAGSRYSAATGSPVRQRELARGAGGSARTLPGEPLG